MLHLKRILAKYINFDWIKAPVFLHQMLPARIAWNLIHKNENIWDYGKTLHNQKIYVHFESLTHKHNINSVLDLGCNEGYLLKRLNAKRKIGVDCGSNIVNRCRKFIYDDKIDTSVIDTDLNVLFSNSLPNSPRADVVICSDILYYLAPELLPPIIFWSFDFRIFRHFKNRLFDNIEQLANTAIIFSDHQFNSGIIRELERRYIFIDRYSNYVYLK